MVSPGLVASGCKAGHVALTVVFRAGFNSCLMTNSTNILVSFSGTQCMYVCMYVAATVNRKKVIHFSTLRCQRLSN